MNPCSCITTTDRLGQTVCRRCHGDYFACECPAHSVRCSTPVIFIDPTNQFFSEDLA